MAFLRRMEIHDLHIDEVVKWMQSGPAIDALKIRPRLSRMVTGMHRDTWIVVQNDTQPGVIERGTRPGVLWALVLQRALARLEADLYDMEIFHDYHWNGMVGTLAQGGSMPSPQGVVAWADDVKILADMDSADHSNTSNWWLRQKSCMINTLELWHDNQHGTREDGSSSYTSKA